ncbi:MAG TPA: universal stress protein [Saprospiraceae bacterium]|nr:universal stress protein [Saprospiraceae bacterium]
MKIKKILVPFDMSEAAKVALKYAIEFCQVDHDLEIHTVTIPKETIIYDGQQISNAIKAIKDSQTKYRGEIKVHFLTGELIETIISLQEKLGIDLIIMGTNQKLQTEDGKTKTSRLVLEADFPVLVVPREEREFGIKKIVVVMDRNEIDDENTLNVLLALAQQFEAKIQVLTIYKDAKEFEHDLADEKIEALLEYHLGSFYENHAFKKSNDLDKAIFEFAENNQMDLLAILPRNHTTKNTPSKGKLTELLTLKTNIPLLTIN